MAYALIVIGLMLTIAGTRGKQNDLFTLVEGDFTGDKSFIYWLIAIAIIGGVGYAPGLKGLSQAFMALVLIVLVLSNQGIFTNFTSALGKTTASPVPATQG